jgi:hypothetical protein
LAVVPLLDRQELGGIFAPWRVKNTFCSAGLLFIPGFGVGVWVGVSVGVNVGVFVGVFVGVGVLVGVSVGVNVGVFVGVFVGVGVGVPQLITKESGDLIGTATGAVEPGTV